MRNMGRLSKEADLSSFIRQISACSGDVLFRTSQGDVLNLRSTLSAYVCGAGGQAGAAVHRLGGMLYR